jgi:hypothetical protein
MSRILWFTVWFAGLAVVLSPSLAAAGPVDVGPKPKSAGPLAFGPGGVLFMADVQAATIFALELGPAASGKTAGTKDIPAIDQKIAALLGTDAREIAIADMAVHPTSKNTLISVTRGQGAEATPVLMRVDGAGEIELISLDNVRYSELALPNPPAADPSARRDPRAQSITDMAFVDGRLFIAGLSSDEFSSKLRSVRYPFEKADAGTSVEIYHAAHGQIETRSPVYTFVPYEVGSEPHLIAGYLCTPLVKFPLASLEPGKKVRGTTIAELGNRNRPLDMIVYKKNGKDFLLMSNTSRGVMKIPTENFGSQPGLTEKVDGGGQAGIVYETVSQMKGVEQLDLLDEKHSLVITRTDSGALNLQVVELP